MQPCLRLEFIPLSSRDKTLHLKLKPRPTESGYERTQTNLLAWAVARII